MSPTAIPSEVPRASKAWAPRRLVITHRYIGVVVGALMLLWCLSGIVMLFVHYPSVPQDERLARLAPIDWSRCCTFGNAVQAPVLVSHAAVEGLDGTPVLRLRLASGERKVIDLATGREVRRVSAETAMAVALGFRGEHSGGGVVTSIARDQWTVSGEFNPARPLWRIRMADPAATDIYVSGVSGEVVQRTTARSRTLNWLGAVPHWLYPTILRQDVKLWSQVVIWTSLVGTFLTITGLYLGIVAWRPFGDKRLSPFRGLMTWHHLLGLATGLLTLTWVASGLVSMNPWGFLDSRDDPAIARFSGQAATFGEVQAALTAVAERHPTVGQVRIAPFEGSLYVLAGGRRYDAQGRLAPLGAADLAKAGRELGPIASQGPITAEDPYYFAHHEPVTLPAWRVIRRDGTRVYLDTATGQLLSVVDPAAQQYRWLHLGLHRLDMIPGFSRGAGWSAAMVALLSAVSLGVGSGVWLAWRRISRDLGRLSGRLRSDKGPRPTV
jgi:uncharacterized iron-regulated membrane protein